MDLVDGEVEDLVFTDSDIALLEKDSRMVKMREGIRKAGLLTKSIENLGTIRIASGYVLMHKEILTTLTRRIADKAEAPDLTNKELIDLAGAAAKMGNTVAKLTQADNERGVTGPNKKGVRRPSFQLGKPVAITQNNYYGNTKPPGEAG